MQPRTLALTGLRVVGRAPHSHAPSLGGRAGYDPATSRLEVSLPGRGACATMSRRPVPIDPHRSALVADPRVSCSDEPEAGLDFATSSNVLDFLERLVSGQFLVYRHRALHYPLWRL